MASHDGRPRDLSWVPRVLALAVVSLGVLAGCGQSTVKMNEGPREYVATDYENILKKWTRSDQLVSLTEMDDVLTVTATFESWDFRWAYVVRYAEDYRLTVEQRRALLERSLAESRRYHQFYVALYAQRHKWGNLTTKNPAWIVRLVDDSGNETAPIEIDRIRSPGAIEITYFPYTTPFRHAYRIRFPTTGAGGPTIGEDAEWFGLRFAGAQGNDELVWLLKEGAEGPDSSPGTPDHDRISSIESRAGVAR